MRPRLLLVTLGFLIGFNYANCASASVLLFDDFNSTSQQLDQYTFANWTVTAGSVDVIGTGGSFDFYPGHGNYVDLNGSTEVNGQLSSKIVFGPGTYTLSFLLGGSKGGGGGFDHNPKTTLVNLGGFTTSITLAPDAGLTSQSFTFSTKTAGNLVFTSLPGGNPNVGNILDNVQVSSVPETSTWIMMLLGFAGMGLFAYRRSRKQIMITSP